MIIRCSTLAIQIVKWKYSLNNIRNIMFLYSYKVVNIFANSTGHRDSQVTIIIPLYYSHAVEAHAYFLKGVRKLI